MLPFQFRSESELAAWRAETFWTKEPETIHWLDEVTAAASGIEVLIDVGANVGLYSLYAASRHSGLQILAVEPVQHNFVELRNNAEANSFHCIETIRCALSSSIGQSRIIVEDSRVGSSGAQLHPIGSIGEKIDVQTIDGLIAGYVRTTLREQSVAVKIDTDGNEFDILIGANHALGSKIIHSIIVETHPHNRKAISEYLGAFGMSEDENFLHLVGHSNHRRKSSGRTEETKVFKCTLS
jgi:FkbM family methyltransferase